MARKAIPVIRVYPWMIALGLSGAALLMFAVIASVDQYDGGMERLTRICGISRHGAYYAIKQLLDEGYVEKAIPSKGRRATVYRAVVTGAEDDGYDDYSRAWADYEI